MTNTYTQIHIHVVFAVQGRMNIITPENAIRTSKYITGIVKEKKQKMITINCMPDHLHFLIGLRPNIALSDLIRDIKSCSTAFIKSQKIGPHSFSWQEGFGAFSYAKSELSNVANYIDNQQQHHHKTTFREEYISLLEEFNIAYDPKYLYEFYE